MLKTAINHCSYLSFANSPLRPSIETIQPFACVSEGHHHHNANSDVLNSPNSTRNPRSHQALQGARRLPGPTRYSQRTHEPGRERQRPSLPAVVERGCERGIEAYHACFGDARMSFHHHQRHPRASSADLGNLRSDRSFAARFAMLLMRTDLPAGSSRNACSRCRAYSGRTRPAATSARTYFAISSSERHGVKKRNQDIV